MNSIVSEKRFISQTLGVPYENLSQSYLRSETELTTTSVIDFTLQTNKKQGSLVTERLLDLNDEFVITHFTVGLKQISAAAPTVQEQLIAPVLTYDNKTAFAGANGSNVSAIYNSDLSWTIDRREFIPQFPMRAFRRVPTTQEATIGAALGIDGFDNGLYAFYPSEPTRINGRQTIDLSVNLNDSTIFTDAGNSYYAVFEARGYLVVNAAS
mgnify:CR=1 FL=1|tara:strand:- start:1756 stop:2388 length:633 start_codon:yes stop_codon:yes gene_type:complete